MQMFIYTQKKSPPQDRTISEKLALSVQQITSGAHFAIIDNTTIVKNILCACQLH